MVRDRRPLIDPHLLILNDMFNTHTGWGRMIDSVRDGACCRIRFTHLDGVWSLHRRAGIATLVEGPPADPDVCLFLSPRSVDQLASVGNDIGDCAVAVLHCIMEGSAELLLLAPASRLARRGYLRLVLASAPALRRYAAENNLDTRLVAARLRSQ